MMLVSAILLTCLCIFATVKHYVQEGFEHDAQVDITTAKDVVNKIFDSTKAKHLRLCKLLSADINLTNAIVENNFTTIKEILEEDLKLSDAEYITLTNAAGIVILRAGVDKKGDDISQQHVISQAMRGRESVDVERGTVTKLAIKAAVPIYSNGKVIAVLSSGEPIGTPAFVDNIKQYSNSDVSLFEHDVRIATTITDNYGNRIIGQRLENQDIVRTVIMLGDMIMINNTLADVLYKAAYWPILGHDGRPIGMGCVAIKMSTATETENKIIYSILLVSTIIMVVVNLAGIFFSMSIVKPLRRTIKFAKSVSDGSLNEILDIQPRRDEIDELAKSLIAMVENLKLMIAKSEEATALATEKNKIAEEATIAAEESAKKAESSKREGMLDAAIQLESIVDVVSTKTTELSTHIEQSNRGAMESSKRLEEAATAMNEMNATVQEVARNASSASMISTDTKKNAQQGAIIVENALKSINEVQEVSLALKSDMYQLDEHAQSISKIMDVISDIADQTNLLALNAAIEAARAGDAGRGFAVVADEVRKLAEKTVLSTNDVGNAIKAIQESTSKSLKSMDSAIERVATATTFANQSGDALRRIVQDADTSADQVSAIATASEEQSAASEEINHSIVEVSVISNQTAEAMGKASQSVEDLAVQSRTLSDLIIKLKSH